MIDDDPSGAPVPRSNISPRMKPAIAPRSEPPGRAGRGREGEHHLQGDTGRAHVGEDRVLQREQHHPDGDDPDDRAPQQGDDHPPRSASGL